MRACRRVLVVALGLLVSLGVGVPAAAADASVGGAAAPDGPPAGGAQFGTPVGHVARNPVAALFRVAPRTVVQGHAPRIAVRIVQDGVTSVAARVDFTPLHHGRPVLKIDLGRVATGRTVRSRWAATKRLKAGTYVVLVHAHDAAGAQLLRSSRRAGRVRLRITARPKRHRRRAAQPPAPVPAPAPAPTPAPAPAPSTSGDVVPGGVFPVQGPHTFGGPDARFGAGRTGHIHQGQDVVAAEGLPVVAPVAGTIVARDYQASGAGYYLTEDTVDGRSFFYAHCQKDSFAVTLGQAVSAGQQLCRVGQTGDATGPHLHFEIWIGGWRRDAHSHPVDPLPQLQSWDV